MKADFERKLARLTSFERAVLLEAMKIPKGRTRTYAEIARAVGRPEAARAVGNALAKNPLPVKIPCHRVVSCTGIGGYSGKGGVAGKRKLLSAEGAP